MSFVSNPLFALFIVLLVLWVLLTVAYCIYKHLLVTDNEHSLKLKELKINANEFNINFDELELGRMIGKGSQGEVFKAHWRGVLIAVKKIDTRLVDDDVVEEFCQEAEIMRKLRHPSLTLFMGVSLGDPHLCILSEMVAQGSVFDILRDQERSAQLTWAKSLQIITDVATGMTYLHQHNPPILHRDLKSLNILVSETWRGKVADFGMTTFHHRDGNMAQCGSPLWMSPEMLRNEPYDEKSDVYSFAVCMWEMYTHEIPYRATRLSPSSLISKVVRENLRPAVPDCMPAPYAGLMRRCWHPEASERPTFKEILEKLEGMLDDKVVVGHTPYSKQELIVVSKEEENPKLQEILTDDQGFINPDSVELFSEVLHDPNSMKLFRDNTVHLANYKGTPCVAKIFQIAPNGWVESEMNKKLEQRVHDAIRDMTTIRHQNIVLFIGGFMFNGLVALVSHRMEHASLDCILAATQYGIGWSSSMQFLVDAAAGMNFLHTQSPPIIHQDLQTKRLLMDGNWRVKISDCFMVDCLAYLKGSAPIKSVWLSPELFSEPGKVTRACNVFSFAYIIWEVLMRKEVWEGDYYNVNNCERALNGERPVLPTGIPPRLETLLILMWHKDPTKRPTFKHVLEELRAVVIDGPPKLELKENVNAAAYRQASILTAYRSKDPVTLLKEWGSKKGGAGCFVINDLVTRDANVLDADVFEATYEAFGDLNLHKYRKKGIVLAKQMNAPFCLKTSSGIETGMEGAYLVQNEKGDQWPVPADTFNELYALAGLKDLTPNHDEDDCKSPLRRRQVNA